MSPCIAVAIVLSFPHTAVVGVPWHATVATGKVVAVGSSTLRPTATRVRRGVYLVTVRFPTAGTWTVRSAGKVLGTVQVDVPRDPLLVDPFAIAVGPDGALLVVQRDHGPLLRVAGGRAQVVAAGVAGYGVAPSGHVAAADGAVYRVDGAAFARVTPAVDADAVAVGADGTVYVTVYDGFVRRITPDGRVATLVDGLSHPHALALAGGSLYVADTEARRIRKLDLASGALSTLGGDVGLTVSVAVAPDGSLWSVDVPRDGTGGGVTRTTAAGVTTRVASLADANGIAIGPDGVVYVNRWEAKRIVRLDPRTGKLEPVARG